MGLFSRKKAITEKIKDEQGILTLYSITLNSNSFYETVMEEFANEIKHSTKTGDGFVIVLNDDIKLEMNLKDDKNFVSQQTIGMANFFSQAPLENEQVLEQAINQIYMFTCIVGIKYGLNSDEKRNGFIVNTIYKIAEKTQSLILYPSMELYTAKGELLISITGETDLENYYPIASSEILKRDANATLKDEERYKKVMKDCDNLGIPHTDYRLGSQIMEEEVVVPSVEEIVKRAVAIFSCALYAECLLMENGSLDLAKSHFNEINKRYGVMNYLSNKEKEYIEIIAPEETSSIQFSWQYERCAVLLWALELMELNDPTDICDVGKAAKVIRSCNSLEELIQKAKVKSSEELLDMQTKILYYDWACVDARIKNIEPPAGLEAGVVQEQHYALNWLIGANGTCEWDDIRTDT